MAKPLDFSDLKPIRRAKARPANAHRLYKRESIPRYEPNLGKSGARNSDPKWLNGPSNLPDM